MNVLVGYLKHKLARTNSVQRNRQDTMALRIISLHEAMGWYLVLSCLAFGCFLPAVKPEPTPELLSDGVIVRRQ